jgi:hypothetical protein
MSHLTEIPVHRTQYSNTQYTNTGTFAFPAQTYSNPESISYIKSSHEFHTFTMRETGLTVVLFTTPADQPLVVSILTPLVTMQNKLIVVDIERLPYLAREFGIQTTTLLKIYKGQVVNILSVDLNSYNVDRFLNPPSSARWRSVDKR